MIQQYDSFMKNRPDKRLYMEFYELMRSPLT